MQPPSGTRIHESQEEDPWNVALILVCTFFVITMQLGFAMLEVGSVRQAHRMTVLAKNVLDSCVSSFAFWGASGWFEMSLTRDGKSGHQRHHLLLFHWAFCTTATTICSGSMAERTHMVAYLLHVGLMAGLIYPVGAESAWGQNGWLNEFFRGDMLGLGGAHVYHDFAGSGMVHLAGACTALVGTSLVGRRILQPQPKRHDELDPETLVMLEEDDDEVKRIPKPADGWPRRFDDARRDEKEFAKMPYLQVMGMFTLWIGWYGFNTGSTLVVPNPSIIAGGIVAWNTTLAAGAGGFGAFLLCCTCRKHLDVSFLCNGVLAGLVSITGCCDVCSEVAAIFIGLTAGLVVYPASSALIRARRIDDPVDAIAVHLGCGLFGVLAVGICRPRCDYLMESVGSMLPAQEAFCSDDHSMGKQLAAQAWGALTIVWWSMSVSLMFWSIFVVCERARALEARHLDEADRLLCAMVLAKSPEVQRNDLRWNNVARYSPLARRALQRHGWGRASGFLEGHPVAPWELQNELRRAKDEQAETALEQGGCCFRWMAESLHSCRITRELMFLRLRIPPAAELSGLGATELDSGQAFPVLRRAMTLLAAARKDHKTGHLPLEREVRDLAMVVRSQEQILQQLMRSGRLPRISNLRRKRDSAGQLPRVLEAERESSGSGSGGSVREAGAQKPREQPEPAGQPPEQLPPPRSLVPWVPLPPQPIQSSPSPSLTVSQHEAQNLRPRGERTYDGLEDSDVSSIGSRESSSTLSSMQAPLAQLQAAVLGRRYQAGSVTSQSSDRTVEERSAGMMSLNSAGTEETPPPTVLGSRSAARNDGGNASARDAGLGEVAGRLVDMLQAHQYLVTALSQAQAQQAGGAAASHPARGGQAAHLVPGSEQRLLDLLERAVAGQQQRPRGNSGRSTPLSVTSSRLGRMDSNLSNSTLIETPDDSARPLFI